MTLVGAGDVLAASRAVGAFNVIELSHIEGIISGGWQAKRPVILQISHNTVRYHGGLAPIGSAALAAAAAAEFPVAVHLDHAESEELVAEAVELGFGSVMFDASRSDYVENVKRTKEVVASCHKRGVWVEAELGEVGGKDGAHAPGARTDPGEAAEFVAATGVDALAVAVGSSHAMLTRDARLDFALISELRAAVPVPLVLHGSSGVADADLRAAVVAGMRKINIATVLNKVFTATVRERLAVDKDLVDVRKYIGPAVQAVGAEVARLLTVLEGDENASRNN